MTSRDWDFVLGSLGDPLADIKDWMLPPYPQCLIDMGVYNTQLKKEPHDNNNGQHNNNYPGLGTPIL